MNRKVLTTILVFCIAGYAMPGFVGAQGRNENNFPSARNPGTITNPAAVAAAANAKNPPTCDEWLDVGCEILALAATLMQKLVVPFIGWLLSIANDIFNFVVQITIRDFSKYAEIPGVQKAWSLARDFVNIGLVFVLLYIAASTILQIGETNTKRVLTSVIVVALLVNFSAFLTGIVIDATNIIANEFYQQAGGNPTNGSAPDISTKLRKGFDETAAQIKLSVNPQTGTLTWDIFFNIIIQAASYSALNIISIVILLAAAIMLLARMITLIFLIVLSPFAAFMWILPKTEKHFSKWSQKLFDTALFAPAFLFMFFLTIQVAAPANGQRGVGDVLLPAGGTSIVSNLVYSFIVNGLMLASLLIAKSFGAYGASGAMGGLKKLGSFALGTAVGGGVIGGLGRIGRGTIGRAGTAASDSAWLKQKAQSSIFGRYAMKAALGARGSTFDIRSTKVGKETLKAAGIKDLGKPKKGGYAERLEEKTKKEEEFAKKAGVDLKNEAQVTQFAEKRATQKPFGTGAALGAAVGTTFMPVVGTAVGAAIGGLSQVGLGKLGEKLKQSKGGARRFVGGWIKNRTTSMTSPVAEEMAGLTTKAKIDRLDKEIAELDRQYQGGGTGRELWPKLSQKRKEREAVATAWQKKWEGKDKKRQKEQRKKDLKDIIEDVNKDSESAKSGGDDKKEEEKKT